jgi:hypothetical protein
MHITRGILSLNFNKDRRKYSGILLCIYPNIVDRIEPEQHGALNHYEPHWFLKVKVTASLVKKNCRRDRDQTLRTVNFRIILLRTLDHLDE